MNVDVHFTTQLRTALGRSSQSVSISSGATVAQLMRQLATEHADAFQTFVLNSAGEYLPNIIVCVDDKQITQLDAHVLEDGDTVTILSAISGG